MADLMVLSRDAFQPIEAVSRLFPQADGSMHALIASAAAANDLPPDFFLRLLRQESGLNPYAVSPVGAQGIAQFMPGTAAERGLRNPFDPGEAIPKSAELLREHRARFGNLGLAAAAYNAGPQRVARMARGPFGHARRDARLRGPDHGPAPGGVGHAGRPRPAGFGAGRSPPRTASPSPGRPRRCAPAPGCPVRDGGARQAGAPDNARRHGQAAASGGPGPAAALRAGPLRRAERRGPDCLVQAVY